MTNYEKKTDFIVAQLLTNAGLDFTMNGSQIEEINEALKTSSKRGTGKTGFPEFVAQSGEFIIVIEDKADQTKQAKYMNDDREDTLLMDTSSVTDYAENGALHYALNIIEKTHFKKVFAFGCSGTQDERIIIRPIFVSENGYQILKKVKNFENFTAEKITNYYRTEVLGSKTVEQAELEVILKRAGQLHEDLRNYGQLGDSEKPLVVSAILLALQEQNFDTEQLTASRENGETDGDKIFDALSKHMDSVHVQPQVKKEKVLDQFRLIKNRPHLSEFSSKLGKSPLRYFAEYLYSNILTAICNNSPEDVLGRFYGEFIRYSGGDGQTLGVVLTPKHITELFVDLADLKPADKVFDPCCGTGGFLISAMHRMLKNASRDEQRTIKKERLHGIELRDDMFSIATTNMILRGDGKSNLICADFLKQPAEELRKKNFTVGFMNPPYSQGKNNTTAELTELKFICHLLDSLADGARCVVIVPQSTMVGKTKEDKIDKRYILENHTLEGVITLNPQTFYGVGTNPVIAVFTAHRPHPKNKYSKFINFKDDGFVVFPHLGLLPTEQAKERKKLLLDCWLRGRPTTNDFMVTSTVEADDEWLHSFYYFNEDIPTEADFEKTMADYLTFEFNMIAHGRGYLFDNSEKGKRIGELPKVESLESKEWKAFFIEKVCEIESGQDIYQTERTFGFTPYITATAEQNGIGYFVGNNNDTLEEDCISVNRNGSVGYAFYHPYKALYGNDTRKLRPRVQNKYASIFISLAITQQKEKYGYGLKMGTGRLKRQYIMLPVNSEGEPDYVFMENYMKRKEMEMLKRYVNFIDK
ncbi:MAG: N-6 DNA methylase [Bacteroidia bacterium]|nr:N-6 DNA methylase [Bacteroidia bacterium]